MASTNKFGNPMMNTQVFGGGALASAPMTVRGSIQKTSLLLAIMTASAAVGWVSGNPIFLGIGALGAFVVAMITYFKPDAAAVTGPIYSILEGLAIGVLSRIYAEMFQKTSYAGIVPLALLATITIFAVMLGLYTARIIRVTETFRAVISGAVLAIVLLYLGTVLVSFAWPGVYSIPIYSAGPIGIAFSVFVTGLAAFRLLLNFDFIERGVAMGAPKSREWYAAFSMMVTVAWLYLEILNLIAKLAGSRR